MNFALPIEEAYRDSKDNNTTLQLVLLDVKAAFDTVIHKSFAKESLSSRYRRKTLNLNQRPT